MIGIATSNSSVGIICVKLNSPPGSGAGMRLGLTAIGSAICDCSPKASRDVGLLLVLLLTTHECTNRFLCRSMWLRGRGSLEHNAGFLVGKRQSRAHRQ